jgi:DNA-directed RNA polymerase specialized sigma24 family protein
MLRGLSVPQRTAVVLKCRHGMTFAEIGLALGLSSSGANRIYLETIDLLRATGKYRALLN